MPRFILTLYDGDKAAEPNQFDAPDIASARSEAVIYLGDLLRIEDGKFLADSSHWRLDLSDRDGLTLYSLTVIGTAAPVMTKH